jgi:hypothetical protein
VGARGPRGTLLRPWLIPLNATFPPFQHKQRFSLGNPIVSHDEHKTHAASVVVAVVLFMCHKLIRAESISDVGLLPIVIKEVNSLF